MAFLNTPICLSIIVSTSLDAELGLIISDVTWCPRVYLIFRTSYALTQAAFHESALFIHSQLEASLWPQSVCLLDVREN